MTALNYDHFRERVRQQVDGALDAGAPVTFDEATSTWSRGALRVTLTPGGDEQTVVASRTAMDLFRVGNTLGMRQDLTEEGLAECVTIVVGWLNNPKLYTAPAPAPKLPNPQ